MYQINFRVDDEEKAILEKIAEIEHCSIAEVAKQFVEKELKPTRIDLAFKLLKEGKISKKKAWKLSGLTYHEFMLEWTRQGAFEDVPENIDEDSLNQIKTLDLHLFLRNSDQ
jgi:predicted HTH domain antitoxin